MVNNLGFGPFWYRVVSLYLWMSNLGFSFKIIRLVFLEKMYYERINE